MRRLGLALLSLLVVLGCGPSDDEVALQKVVELRQQDLQQAKEDIKAQAAREKHLAELEKELQAEAGRLELGPVPIEDVEQMPKTIAARLKALHKEATVELSTLGEMELDASGFAYRRGRIQVSGAPEAVQGVVKGLATEQFGRVTKVQDLKLIPKKEIWSGTVVVDFYVKAKRTPSPTEDPDSG